MIMGLQSFICCIRLLSAKNVQLKLAQSSGHIMSVPVRRGPIACGLLTCSSPKTVLHHSAAAVSKADTRLAALLYIAHVSIASNSQKH